jgi:hypothetical protein
LSEVPGIHGLPARVLSRLYRRLFLAKLMAAHRADKLRFFGDLSHLAEARAFSAFLAPLRGIEWLVYAKRPFAGPDQVLAYLARYTHRVAISNHRLVALSDGRVTFTWRDYRDAAKIKELCGKVGDGVGKGRRRISGGVSQPHIQTRIDTPWKRLRSSPCASRARSPIR